MTPEKKKEKHSPSVQEELEGLPGFPTRDHVDRMIEQFPDNKTITAAAIANYAQIDATALRARLRLAVDLLYRYDELMTAAELSQWTKDCADALPKLREGL